MSDGRRRALDFAGGGWGLGASLRGFEADWSGW